MQSFRDPYSCTMISNSAKDKTQFHKLSTAPVLIQHTFAQSSSLTINSDLAVSIFVCSLEERFRLIVCEISSLLGKALENIPVDHTNRTRVCRGEFVPSGAGLSAYGSHFSSSSSIKPLPSTSRTLKTSLTLSGDMALRPTNSKNFFGSKVSSKIKKAQKASAESTIKQLLSQSHV